MNTFEAGRRAESVAAAFLSDKGCRIVTQNWRTRWCEIDIIAERNSTLYFCEVKYRIHARQGVGIDYITAKKLRQMRFAAEFWLAKHTWSEDIQLCALEVSGPSFLVTRAIKIDV